MCFYKYPPKCLFFLLFFYNNKMPYEYRVIKEMSRVAKNYNQLDIYFFKPKLATVGIKVRFDGERR